jgi:presenilin-like A22 family membrane protease
MTQETVKQPTAEPTRKVTAATMAGGVGGALALLAVESLQQVPGLEYLSEGAWTAVGYLLAAGIAALGAFAGGYMVEERVP